MKKSVILDFDNTIGFFEQIIFLINIIEKTYNESLNTIEISNIIEYYPKIFRPKLFEIIQFILYFQKNKRINLFILYTRNTKPHFVEAIISFLEKKIDNTNIFNYILYEKTKQKNIKTILENIQKEEIDNNLLCFIDNKYFKYEIDDSNIKYIKCKNYNYKYEISEIIKYFPYHIYHKINKNLIKLYFQHKKNNKKKQLPYSLYELNSSFILQSIEDFIQI